MNNQLDQSLTRAYDLIEANRHSDALQIIKPLVESHPENPDVWWVYAHATDDPEGGKEALSRVARLDPNYPGLAELNQQLAGEMPASGIRKLGDSDLDDDYGDIFENDLDFDGAEVPKATTSPRNRRRLLLPLAAAAVILIVIVIAALLLSGGDDNGSGDDPTNVAATSNAQSFANVPSITPLTIEDTSEPVVTEEPTDTDEAATETPEPTESATDTLEPEPTDVPTDEPQNTPTSEPTSTPTDEPTEEGMDLSTFSEFDLAAPELSMIESDLGMTAVLSVCTGAGSLRDMLNGAMTTFASEFADDGEADAIAVSLVNCDVDQIVNTIGVDVSTANQFASGAIDEAAFLREWQVITAG